MNCAPRLKIIICSFLLTILVVGISETCLGQAYDSEEKIGTVIKIEDKKIIIQSDNEEITIFVKNSEAISIGNYIRVICYPVADARNVFAAEEIEILQD